MTATIDSIYPKVGEIIADVLSIDIDKIQLNKSLVNDLGAESIDFLYLVFCLEREFKIKIPQGQIEERVRASLAEGEFDKAGIITSIGIAVLRNYLSEVPKERFKQSMKVGDIPTLFTVETFCKLVVNAKNST